MPLYRLKHSAVPSGVKKIRLEVSPTESRHLAAGEVFEGSVEWRMWLKTHLVELPAPVAPVVEVRVETAETASVEITPSLVDLSLVEPVKLEEQPDPQPEQSAPPEVQPEPKVEEPSEPKPEVREIAEVPEVAPEVTEVKPEPAPRPRRSLVR
jgi:hypothetical protein